MAFQIHALDPAPFRKLFDLPDEELKQHLAHRMEVDAEPGFPCRISLEDARVGEHVILLNYCHMPAASPYQASHAIFIREGAEQAMPEVGQVPLAIAQRLISWRAFDTQNLMQAAGVCKGDTLSDVLPAVLEDPQVKWIDLHNAKPGCFAARVTRAEA